MCSVDLKREYYKSRFIDSIRKNKPLRICLLLVLCSAVDGLDAISTPICWTEIIVQNFTTVEIQETYKGFVCCSNLVFRGIFGNSKDFVGFHDWSKERCKSKIKPQVFWGDFLPSQSFCSRTPKKTNMRPLV